MQHETQKTIMQGIGTLLGLLLFWGFTRWKPERFTPRMRKLAPWFVVAFLLGAAVIVVAAILNAKQ